MTTAQGERLTLREDVVWREADGAVIVLDPRSSLYLSIGGSGPVLWPLLVEGTTVGGLAETLVGRFEIAADTARRDVDTFLAGLRAHDLLLD